MSEKCEECELLKQDNKDLRLALKITASLLYGREKENEELDTKVQCKNCEYFGTEACKDCALYEGEVEE